MEILKGKFQSILIQKQYDKLCTWQESGADDYSRFPTPLLVMLWNCHALKILFIPSHARPCMFKKLMWYLLSQCKMSPDIFI